MMELGWPAGGSRAERDREGWGHTEQKRKGIDEGILRRGGKERGRTGGNHLRICGRLGSFHLI